MSSAPLRCKCSPSMLLQLGLQHLKLTSHILLPLACRAWQEAASWRLHHPRGSPTGSAVQLDLHRQPRRLWGGGGVRHRPGAAAVCAASRVGVGRLQGQLPEALQPELGESCWYLPTCCAGGLLLPSKAPVAERWCSKLSRQGRPTRVPAQ